MLLDLFLNGVLKITKPFYYKPEPSSAFTEAMSSIRRMNDKLDADREENDRVMEAFYRKYPDCRPKHP